MTSADAAPRADPVLPPAPEATPQLDDRAAAILAIGAWAGAVAHHPVPVIGMVATVAVVAALRRPVVLVIGVAIVASGLAARSHTGLRPVAAGSWSGVVTLVSDPVATPFGWRADVRVDGRRVELSADDAAGGSLGVALTGERVRVEGRLAPPRPGSPWLVPRHVVGRLDARSVDRVDAGGALWRAANRFRRLVQSGASTMGEPERALYAGFVLGDDRDQAPEVVDDFRGAGLTHLLVVSGQNVAFVLVLISPVTSRLGWRGRWAATIAVIAAFGVVTRFEPSVLRASAMAAVAVTAGAVGRPTGSLRTLALAITGLLLVDPLLVHSTGFQLSVGASLGIALLAARIAAVIPGPRVLAEALGVTLAAQFGVAPVLVPFAGGLPVVSLIANPLAVPVAGLVTTWGLPAGVAAAVGGPGLAAVVHAPTELMIRWVAAVARVSASLPLGSLGWPHLAGVAVALAFASRPPPVRYLAVPIAAVALLAPAVALRAPPAAWRADGIAVHRAGGATVVVADGVRPGDALELLRGTGVRRIDLLLVDGGDAPELTRVLRHRWPVRRVIDTRDAEPQRVQVGRLVVAIAPPAPPDIQVRSP